MRMCAGLRPLPEHPAPRRGQERGEGEGEGGESDKEQQQLQLQLGELGEGLHRRRLRPHVVLANRRFTAGRSILRLDEVSGGGVCVRARVRACVCGGMSNRNIAWGSS
jgi:hypothetical protein